MPLLYYVAVHDLKVVKWNDPGTGGGAAVIGGSLPTPAPSPIQPPIARRELGITRPVLLFTALVPIPMGLFFPWLISRWHLQPAFFALEPLRWLGALMMPIGGRTGARCSRTKISSRGSPANSARW